MRSSMRRAERLIAGAIAAQLLVAVPTAVVLGPGKAPERTTRTTHADILRAGDDARAQEVRALLQRRSAAVLRRDKRAFVADLDPTQTAFVARQSTVFDRLAAVPLGSWSYDIDPERYRARTPELDTRRGDWWSPDALLTYALKGYDSVPTEQQQGLTFVRRDGRWYLAADDDFADDGHPTQKNLWDTGDVRVIAGPSCLVLSHRRGAALAAKVKQDCEAAVPRVTAFWGNGWLRKVVVVVPDSAKELQQLVPGIGDVSNIAAVATAELIDPASGYHPVGDRVVVNPASFRDLGPVGRQVVLTHEVTHVASRAATGPHVPTWMVEGLADYVGFTGSDVPLDLATTELRKAMRAGRVPVELPIDSEFMGGREDLAETYEMSWLAVTLLIRTYGKDRFLALYREIGSSSSAGIVEVAFATELKTTVGAFTKTWIADLRRRLL